MANLKIARILDYNVRREKPSQKRIVDPPLGVHESEVVEHFVAGEAAGSQAVGSAIVGGSRRT